MPAVNSSQSIPKLSCDKALVGIGGPLHPRPEQTLTAPPRLSSLTPDGGYFRIDSRARPTRAIGHPGRRRLGPNAEGIAEAPNEHRPRTPKTAGRDAA